MTAIPEAQLAREAELCYAVMAHVTDYDCWHVGEEAVSVDLVIKTLRANAELVKRTIRNLASRIRTSLSAECECRRSLSTALLTPLNEAPSEMKDRLHPILEKYL
jgi:methylthioadenosine phosphorylase (EC 2.4.2.28)